MFHAPHHRYLQVAALGLSAVCSLFVGAVHAAPSAYSAHAKLGGSLAYVRGGNVWVSRPDGSHQHMVTHDGTASNPYQYPTQANDGSVEVERSWTTLIHLNRNGRVLGPKIIAATGPNNNAPLHNLAFNPAVAPNGRYVAASIFEYEGTIDPSTGLKGTEAIAQDIWYYDTRSGKAKAKTHFAGTDLTSVSWIDNVRTLVFAPYNITAAQVDVDKRNGPGWAWFADTSADDFLNRQQINNGQLTRQQNKMAVIRGTNLQNDWRHATIQIYSVAGLHAAPKEICAIPAKHGALNTLSWSPDGNTIAWSDSNGIWESPVRVGSSNCGISPRLVIKGAKYPFWGLAGVAR